VSTDTVHEPVEDLAEKPTATMSTPERLRMLADWYEQHPTAEPPSIERIRHFCMTAAELAATAVALGGDWQKEIDGDYFRLTRQVIPGVEYRLYSTRGAVCTKRVIGTETVLEPDPDAPKIEVEKEIVEWECAPSLLALSNEEGRPATAMAGARDQGTSAE